MLWRLLMSEIEFHRDKNKSKTRQMPYFIWTFKYCDNQTRKQSELIKYATMIKNKRKIENAQYHNKETIS